MLLVLPAAQKPQGLGVAEESGYVRQAAEEKQYCIFAFLNGFTLWNLLSYLSTGM